jgi:hypothetical protein
MTQKVKVAGVPGTDPTMPLVSIELAGNTYYLAFTFKAMALAQKNLRDIGVDCNLIKALDFGMIDAEKFAPLLYAALITHQPSLTVQQVVDFVTLDNFVEVYTKIIEAYTASIAKPAPEDVKADPTQAE